MEKRETNEYRMNLLGQTRDSSKYINDEDTTKESNKKDEIWCRNAYKTDQ